MAVGHRPGGWAGVLERKRGNWLRPKRGVHELVREYAHMRGCVCVCRRARVWRGCVLPTSNFRFCRSTDDLIAQDDFWQWKEDDLTWDHCEPSDLGNQDCMHMFGDGTWGDLGCYVAADAFFVEFDGA